MTPRENLMRCLSGGAPERMPVCVHVTNANNLPGHLPAELLAEPVDWLAVSEFVGGDILHEVAGVRTILPDGFGVETRREGDASVSTLTTPRGVLSMQMAMYRWSSFGGPMPTVRPAYRVGQSYDLRTLCF